MSTTSSMAANKEKKNFRWGTFLLFVGYLFLLFYLLLFSEEMGRTDAAAYYRYNLIPFFEIRRFLENMDTIGYGTVMMNIGGNILAFMPFGYFLPRLFRCRHLLLVTVYGALLSSIVEFLQFIFRIGCFDVDDIILNTMGAFLGYLFFLLFHGNEKKQA